MPARVARRPYGLVLLAVIALVGLIAAGWSSYRLYQQLHRPARETDVSRIQPWMTLGLLARTYGVSPAQLERAPDLPLLGDSLGVVGGLAAFGVAVYLVYRLSHRVP